MFALLLTFIIGFAVSPAETNLQLRKSNAALREALKELTQEIAVGRPPAKGTEQSVGKGGPPPPPNYGYSSGWGFKDSEAEGSLGKGEGYSSSETSGVKGSGTEKSVGGWWGCEEYRTCYYRCKECRRCNKWECIDTKCDGLCDTESAVGRPPAKGTEHSVGKGAPPPPKNYGYSSGWGYKDSGAERSVGIQGYRKGKGKGKGYNIWYSEKATGAQVRA